MGTDFSQAARSLGEAASVLARRWATQRLGAVQSYGRILSDYGAGRMSGRAAAEAYAKLAVEEAARYPADAIQIASDYASAVGRIAGLPLGGKTSQVAPVLDIEMSGPLGGTAAREFVLENPHETEARIAFAASPFRDDESELKAAPAFDPAEMTIPACGERKVTVSAKLDRRKFKSGRTYRSNAAVAGFDEMVIRIHLTVTEAA